MSRLLQFYRLEKPDSEDRMLSELWDWSIDDLEQIHDFIQWMFPLSEPSAFNPDAPLVTPEDQRAFASDLNLQSNLRRSLDTFLRFLGLERIENHIALGENFDNRINLWQYSNHNWLRITRVLKSLRLLSLEAESKALFECLKDLHEQRGFISDHTYSFWVDAMQ